MRNAPVASTWARRFGAPKVDSLLQAITRAVARCVARLEHEARIRRDLATLQSVDDHLLADIGLTRGRLERAIRDGEIPPIETAKTMGAAPRSMPPVLLLNLGTLTFWRAE